MSHFSRKCYTNVKKQLVVNAGMTKSLLSRLDTGYVPSPRSIPNSAAHSPQWCGPVRRKDKA